MAEKKPELRVILLGNVGEGKSATGNFILHAKPFESNEICNAVTLRTSSSSGCLGFCQKEITVVDTPGFFGNTEPMLQTALEVHKSLDYVKPGPHAFLLVIKLGRMKDDTAKIIELMNMIFGPNFSNYMIIIFTHEDRMKNLEAFMQTLMENASMKNIIHACSGRHITLNNDDLETREEKLKQLLKLVNEVSNNGNNPYDENSDSTRNVLERHIKEWNDTHLSGEQMKDILNEVEKEKEKRRQEEERRRQEEENRRQEEERRRQEEENRRQEEERRRQEEENRRQEEERRRQEEENRRQQEENRRAALKIAAAVGVTAVAVTGMVVMKRL